ncbi:hypothetical protein GW17_00012460 [Ensete ventricosum]|nr:hypothetical protein GW17_00012460 [Ensete ventricosum]
MKECKWWSYDRMWVVPVHASNRSHPTSARSERSISNHTDLVVKGGICRHRNGIWKAAGVCETARTDDEAIISHGERHVELFHYSVDEEYETSSSNLLGIIFCNDFCAEETDGEHFDDEQNSSCRDCVDKFGCD